MTKSKDTDAIPMRMAYTLREACVLLGGISMASIYRYARLGKLKFTKIGGRTLISASEIKRLAGQSGDGERDE